MGRKFKCVICGRPFPEGQGVIVSRGGLTLTFHSSRCAYKFFKLFMERLDEKHFADIARSLVSELEKMLEYRRVKTQKRI